MFIVDLESSGSAEDGNPGALYGHVANDGPINIIDTIRTEGAYTIDHVTETVTGTNIIHISGLASETYRNNLHTHIEGTQTETVNAVRSFFLLLGFISGNSNSSIRCFVIDRQISPLPYFAIKLIASGVAIWAGIIKSPSFSLPGSSTRIYILPFRASSIISSIVDRFNVLFLSAINYFLSENLAR